VIISRNDDKIRAELNVKTLTCIGLKNSEISQKLLKLTTKSSV